jgi:hypothetical protein
MVIKLHYFLPTLKCWTEPALTNDLDLDLDLDLKFFLLFLRFLLPPTLKCWTDPALTKALDLDLKDLPPTLKCWTDPALTKALALDLKLLLTIYYISILKLKLILIKNNIY